VKQGKAMTETHRIGNTVFVRGSGDVFADMGLPDADEHNARVGMVEYPTGTKRRGRFETPTARPMLVAAQSEAEFMTAIIAEATRTGWLVYHTRRSDGSEPGFPDLVLVRQGRLVIAELKRVGGTPTMEQVTWLLELARVPGVEVYAWDANDWDAVFRTLE
jgi:hypothetical protein